MRNKKKVKVKLKKVKTGIDLKEILKYTKYNTLILIYIYILNLLY